MPKRRNRINPVCTRILLLDDSGDDALLFESMIMEEMAELAQFHWCRDCKTAEEMIQTQEIDVCLVDYHLGADINGLQWAQRCFHRYGEMGPALLLLTGLSDVREIDARAGSDNSGIIDFLVKRELTATTLERTIRFACKQQRLLREMRLREIRARLFFDYAREGIVTLDKDGRITQANRSAERLFNYAPDTMPGLFLSQLIPDFSMNRFRPMGRDARPFISDSSIHRVSGYARNGKRLSLEMSLGLIHSEYDMFYTAGFLDISHHLSAVEEMRQQAETDELTGLMNRRRFRQKADQELRRAARNQHPMAIMMLDIDHFKRINDTFGHAVGDVVLRDVAKQLKQGRREQDILCRWGGEEFLILLPESNTEAAQALAERIRHAVETTSFDAFSKPVTISIGIADVDVKQPLKVSTQRADQALYRAKEEGRNRVCCFSGEARMKSGADDPT